MNRAWSVLDIKSFDDDARTFKGIASTISTDRMDDIVEPQGAKYQLPITMMWEHGKKDITHPVGWITSIDVSKKQIEVEGKFAKLSEPPSLKEGLDSAWAQVKSKLVRGLSIGFNPLESEPIKNSFGQRYTSWEFLELSPVSIPANQDANILTVKSADSALLALSGKTHRVVQLGTTSTSPTVVGHSKGKPMTLREQIQNAEAKLTANEKRLDEIALKSTETGYTRTQEEIDECNSLEQESKDISEHIAFLKRREKTMVATATVVETKGNGVEKQSEQIRKSEPVQVKSMAPKGILPARMAIAMYKGGNVPEMAATVAKRLWPDAPEVELTLRAAVEAGDTTTSGWASQLVPAAQQSMTEFIEFLRHATILGRIPGLRRVPFNIAVPVQTASGTYGWVGEGAGKPVTSLTFSSVTLRWAKAAGIIVITEELARFSSPSAEMIIRDDMVAGLTRFFDEQFVSANAEVTNVSPAGILNGLSGISPSGTSASAFRVDMNNLLNNFTANKVDPSSLVLIMSATQAIALSLMNTDLGVSLFPNVTAAGGNVLGIPVVVSEAVGTKIIALSPRDILLAEDNGIRVDVSREASVEMETTPAVGESSPITTLGTLKSLWQNNLVGFRVERYITWKRGRDAAVEFITGNAYVPS